MKRIEVVAAIIEHEDARWLAPDELRSVKWLPADEGIIELLACRCSG